MRGLCWSAARRVKDRAIDGHIDLRDDVPGLGLTIKEDALQRFTIIE